VLVKYSPLVMLSLNIFLSPVYLFIFEGIFLSLCFTNYCKFEVIG
jgi:hypothetical protein